MQKPIIMAFLQNQWFRDPERVKQIRQRPEWAERPRHDWNRTWLFFGCLTGRRLQAALGEELCQTIIWEEISPKISGTSAGRFPADFNHIKQCLEEHPPTLVLAFGRPAADALAAVQFELQQAKQPIWQLRTCCHPTARGAGVVERLNAFGRAVQQVHQLLHPIQDNQP